jgi:hypothetical protein
MTVDLSKELAQLPKLMVKELRLKYAEVFGEPTNAANKDWLVKRIAWRMQANALGGLSERALRRAVELANDSDLRLNPPKTIPMASAARTNVPQRDPRLPIPGTILVRDYKGKQVQVQVLKDGFQYDGANYFTLSAVAKAITGSHCNGFHFFRLAKSGGQA